MTTCSMTGCDRDVFCRGMCRPHYMRDYHARTRPAPKPKPPPKPRAKRTPRAARVEDALWLLDIGEHPLQVFARVGFPSVGAMEKAMRMEGVPIPPEVKRELSIIRWAKDKARAAA